MKLILCFLGIHKFRYGFVNAFGAIYMERHCTRCGEHIVSYHG